MQPYRSGPLDDLALHEVLTEFANTNGIKQTAAQRARLLAYVAAEYEAGRSLRELRELTSRSQAAVRRALDQAGVPRRGVGAPRVGRSGS